MNTSKLKAYAPAARREFIKAVTDRAGILGLSQDKIEPVEIQGDVAVIAGRPLPREVGKTRQQLEDLIKRKGFDQVMEEAAYTWFNRFVALRYMELHDYLGHGYRVLSNSGDSDVPEILEKAASIDLPGLDREKVAELRLAGDRDHELYRMLIIAQCSALNKVMPFLFERFSKVMELLLPDNLLQTNSPLRTLVKEIPETDWQEIEIVGWLYQFYISEKKGQVIGKVVKSEDIPAATQLFTPNWIVKYMVQNTLGRKWLMTYPESSLRHKMEFYIEPADQEPEVQARLDAITPNELNPEELTLMDPGCGSGHILAQGYDLFKEIYLERGYRTRDIPRLILEKNLYGLDIDDRAAQLSRFTLFMKARADDRRILSADNPVQLNVMSIQESNGLQVDDTLNALSRSAQGDGEKVIREEIESLLCLFEHGKTFGSLLTVPDELKTALPGLEKAVEDAKAGDMQAMAVAERVEPLVRQAMLLAGEYDFVVANPPYMGNKGLNPMLKKFAKDSYPDSKSDLFAMFIDRNLQMTQEHGFSALITMQSWMFLSSFEKLRNKLLDTETIITMAHLGARAFDSISGEVVQTTTFVLFNERLEKYKGTYLRLTDEKSEQAKIETIRTGGANRFFVSASDFKKIPGSPIAYWVSRALRDTFIKYPPITKYASPKKGMMTGDNAQFLRIYWEVSRNNIFFGCRSHEESLRSDLKWYPHNKGGEFRKWYGNEEFIVNFLRDGDELKSFDKYGERNPDLYFKEGLSWTKITSSNFSARYSCEGHLYDDASCVCPVYNKQYLPNVLGALNSKVGNHIIKSISQTLNFSPGEIAKLPLVRVDNITLQIKELIHKSKSDWDSYETSWDFTIFPLLNPDHRSNNISSTYSNVRNHWQEMTNEMKRLEEENNRIFIEAYGLQDELTPDVPLNEITLTCNPHYRYGGSKSEDELEAMLRADTMKELISYAIGCMMGRYSLDEPGLIYANSANEGFDPGRYENFPADGDGILPIMDDDWFDEDATARFQEFIAVAWPKEHLKENLKFIADSLDPRQGETSIQTIRRFISTSFLKDYHLRVYKKRPIYWLFSSGKKRAFQCLVYLHRYNEATLSRMRGMYVTPLMGKYKARLEFLEHEFDNAGTNTVRNKVKKEIQSIKDKLDELRSFDELLRHFADQRISLDLDDGVKVNYGKFGGLLAEVKAVIGKKAEGGKAEG
ncbi:BREX-1 system adenine-specific DNA-methyltransferase PglX [Desulfonatronovibrio magnus]|uniref:BREX-1 system adenine-specific DNA-methyltransferase PglX n=1 Tax=Desulfonatronovibrio magnus TaxID=698827 RepID=UPI0005EBECA9|nr:BREX-1 system adenine-specific DNA-methyltransferase PglX [Desulfonatronovibrio magnus]